MYTTINVNLYTNPLPILLDTMSTASHDRAVPEQAFSGVSELESSKAKLVYLALLVTEEATTTELQRMLDLPKLTLLPILTSLVHQDLAQCTEDGYACQ
ncbi:MarR family transcriptional regulator [Halostagnicola sp. A56]|uniref:MarR family transcriptional regulator n=1 Tax=Halostagnicola sp. A56 TaxID=1495067 RepID=UPI0026C9D364